MVNWNVVTFIVIAFILSRLRVIPSNERRAVFILEQFKRFCGPGLMFKWPGGETKWVGLRLGQRGELLNETLADFDGYAVPVYVEGSRQIGQMVRILDFDEDKVRVIQDANQLQAYKCEKCGHENHLS